MPDNPQRLREFSAVTFKRGIVVQGMSMPAGAHGVVVGAYADGLAYEIELTSPHVVLIVDHVDLQFKPAR